MESSGTRYLLAEEFRLTEQDLLALFERHGYDLVLLEGFKSSGWPKIEVVRSAISGDRLADVRRKQIGFIFQDFYLMDSLSVEENIMLPMILGREKESVMTKAAQEYAEKFLISHLVKKNPYELSGGEKQRVAICRALINDPDLVLADEPTGNLDSKSGKIVIDALTQINREFKKTIVMVTHDPQMASYCSRIILLKDGLILDTLKRGESQEAFYQEIIGRMAEL